MHSSTNLIDANAITETLKNLQLQINNLSHVKAAGQCFQNEARRAGGFSACSSCVFHDTWLVLNWAAGFKLRSGRKLWIRSGDTER